MKLPTNRKKVILTAKQKAARELGRAGGFARAAKLTQEQRSDIARKAAAARWAKRHDCD